MMGAMELAHVRGGRTLGAPPPTARSVLLRFALGSAAAIAVVVVGGYFALRSVAIDEAKRETRTKVVEAGQLVEATLGDGLLPGDAGGAASGRRRRRRTCAQQLDRAGEDLVDGRARPLLGRPGPDRRPLTRSTTSSGVSCATAAPRWR